MPRDISKDSQTQKADEELDEIGSPHVDREADDEQLDERVPQKSGVRKNEEEANEELDDEDTAENIDLDDLAAMEGPDA